MMYVLFADRPSRAFLMTIALAVFMMRGPSAVGEPFQHVGEIEGDPFHLLQNHGVTFTSDSNAFVSQTVDHVILWDARTLKPLTQPLVSPELDDYSVVGNGRSLFTTGHGEVRLWDVATSKLRAVVTAGKNALSFFDASGDGARFLTISREDIFTMTVWSVSADRLIELYHRRYKHPLCFAHFDPSRTYIVTKEVSGTLHLLNAETGRDALSPFETDPSAPCEAHFDPSGKQLAVPLEQGFKVLESRSGRTLAQGTLSSELGNQSLGLSADGSLVISMTVDRVKLEEGPVLVFDATTGKRVSKFGKQFFTCQIAPGNRWALCNIVGHEYSKPEVWDLREGVPVQTFFPPAGNDHIALMSPDGQTILVGSAPHKISVWRAVIQNPTTQP